MDILKIAEQNQQAGLKLLDSCGIITAWENIGATVHLVGSLKSGLMMKKLDIDLHIYTPQLRIADSFTAIRQLAEKLPFTEIQYRNLIDTEEECLEWHALYKDQDCNTWKFDMIHIRQGSKYDGTVEKVTEAIIRQLTPEIRRIILGIKNEVPGSMLIPGIEIYHAVFTGGVRNYTELQEWRNKHPLTNSLEWIP